MFAAYPLVLVVFLWQDAYSPAKLVTAVSPAPSLMSVYGGEVVLNAGVDTRGNVREVRVIHGRSPFNEQAAQAVSQWTFIPAQTDQPVDSRVSATILFRPRSIFPIGPPVRLIQPSLSDEERPPFPLAVSDPGYPVDSVAEGVVILQLQISADGSIQNVQVIRDVPSLTGAAEEVVRSWVFSHAKAEGRPVPGTAVVAISFLRPVVQP